MGSRDTTYMRLAIAEAAKCVAEDSRPHPKVGVVVVREANVLATAFRGETGDGQHAEYGALEKKLKTQSLAGTTVYTTLEPCTTRNHPKHPCAEWLIERKVGRVVIGMLDPDQRICGRGLRRLREANIETDLFPSPLMSQVEEQNREFARHHQRLSSAYSQLSDATRAAGLIAFIPSREYYALLRPGAPTIDKYVATAKRTVVIVSINLMTGIPFDDLCRVISNGLGRKEGLDSAVVSLLNPDNAHLMHVVGPVLNMTPDGLARDIRGCLQKLVRFKVGLPDSSKEHMEIRVHDSFPFGSAILLDHKEQCGRIQIETKPYRAVLNRSLAFEISQDSPSGLYSALVTGFEALLGDGRVWSGAADRASRGSRRKCGAS